MREIKEKHFDKGLRTLLADEYEEVGKIMSLSILQNAPFPNFLSEKIVQELFFEEHPSPCVSYLRKGFCSLGLYQIGRNLPLFLHLMRPSNATKLSRRKLVTLLRPCFSEEGSNARKHENDMYAVRTFFKIHKGNIKWKEGRGNTRSYFTIYNMCRCGAPSWV